MIGNDVVDLRLARHQSNWRRKGFLEKVFTAYEQQVIGSAADKNQVVWLMWSMKEAAYKAHQRRFGLPRKLNWSSFECHLRNVPDRWGRGVVSIDRSHYYSSSRVTPELIHTYVVGSEDLRVRSRLFIAETQGIGEKLLAEITVLHELEKKDISLGKDEQGIPYINLRDTRYPLAFSLSGHGRFAAFSVPLTNC